LDTIPGLRAEMEDPGLKYYDFKQFEFILPYEMLYEEWFVLNVFGDSDAKINKKKFIKKLAAKQKLEYVFNAFDLR
jgi:hypothetical protein